LYYLDLTFTGEEIITSSLFLYTRKIFPFFEIATGNPFRKAFRLAALEALLTAALKDERLLLLPFFIAVSYDNFDRVTTLQASERSVLSIGNIPHENS